MATFQSQDSSRNLAGDKYLWDDFAYAAPDDLVCDVNFSENAKGIDGRFAEIDFDFQLQHAQSTEQEMLRERGRG